jgi:hypothetical protein
VRKRSASESAGWRFNSSGSCFLRKGPSFLPHNEPQKEDAKFPQIARVLTGHFSMEKDDRFEGADC